MSDPGRTTQNGPILQPATFNSKTRHIPISNGILRDSGEKTECFKIRPFRIVIKKNLLYCTREPRLGSRTGSGVNIPGCRRICSWQVLFINPKHSAYEGFFRQIKCVNEYAAALRCHLRVGAEQR